MQVDDARQVLTDREIREWATRVVAVYKSRVTLTLLEQGELERALAARFRVALEEGRTVADWAEPANAALAEWEHGHPQRGTRVSGFSVSGKQVIEKRRSY